MGDRVVFVLVFFMFGLVCVLCFNVSRLFLRFLFYYVASYA